MARGLSELQKRILEIAFETYCNDPLVPTIDDDSAPQLSDEEFNRHGLAILKGEPLDESVIVPHRGVKHVEHSWVVAEMLGVDLKRKGNDWETGFRHDDKYSSNWGYPSCPGRRRYTPGINVDSKSYNKAMVSVSRSMTRLVERGLINHWPPRPYEGGAFGDLTTKGLEKCVELFGRNPPTRAWELAETVLQK